MRKKIRNYAGRNFRKKRTKDKLTRKNRSILMSQIRSKGTKFEQDFIIFLKKSTSKKFLTNVTSIKGKPDIIFKKAKICIFLDSDFWHGWQYTRWKHLLKNNFWRKKIRDNKARDVKTTLFLKRQGWTVLRFWEHAIKRKPLVCLDKINQALS